MQPDLLARYADRPLLRYTSYPTAPHFGADVNSDTYREWLGQLSAGEPVSLYIHVPFCRSMCWYCGCHHDHDPHALLQSAPSLDDLIADGIARREGTIVALDDEARPLVRVLAAAFDQSLGAAPARHSRAV